MESRLDEANNYVIEIESSGSENNDYLISSICLLKNTQPNVKKSRENGYSYICPTCSRDIQRS